MAARSTHVTLTNNAGRFNLRKTGDSLDHGEWTSRPPKMIGNLGEWESESNGFATGTEGGASYLIEDDTGVVVGNLDVHWDNPFVGANSYSQSVNPQAAEGGIGFSIGHLGGDGNNASVEFRLLNGDCTFSENGEVFCTQAGPLVAAESQRYAAIWQKDGGPSLSARHGLTPEQYQETFNELTAQGYRPTCVSGNEVNGADSYAAIFEKRGGPAFQARHGLTSDQYQQTFNELTAQGFRPRDVSGYAVQGEARFAAIFEQDGGPAFQARHGLTSDQYQQTFNELTAKGFAPAVVSGYSVDGQDFFAAVFEKRDGPPFAARHGLDSQQYQQTFNDMVGQGFRLTQVSGYTGSR